MLMQKHLTLLPLCTAPCCAAMSRVLCLQRELTSKVQRIDALQAELNATQVGLFWTSHSHCLSVCSMILQK